MRIVKRKIGKSTYLYLQHAYRSKGKVITRERYLGKEIPANIEEIKRKLQLEANKEVYQKLENIKKHFQSEWNRCPESVKEQEKQEIAIAFTYNTNAIEGSTITLEEVREILQQNISPHRPLKDIRETESHARVFLKMLSIDEKISHKLLLQWHKEIFGETKQDIAGSYRHYLVRVGMYIAPHWKDVRGLMDQLITFINKAKLNDVELAARARYQFEKIHPFGDGNGRIGRLIMNHLLWHHGYPMLIIEYKKRASYYRALQRGEEGFVSYFLRTYLSVHRNRLH